MPRVRIDMTSKWIIKSREAEGKAPLGIHPSIYRILSSRGIADSAMPDFLSTRPKVTYDPFLMPDMREAAEKILAAARAGRRICVYGDYDADGVTSTALLTQVLKLITDNVFYYIPSRFVDGYGLNIEAVHTVKERGAELIVTVDCGSTSPAEVECARQLGMDIIVTDHHTPDAERTPDCLFINPKREGSEYPFRELSGCGVVFKLAQALQRLLCAEGSKAFPKAVLGELTDLVAISSVADVVPLLGENRTLVKYGLEYIARRSRPGLKILLEHLGCGDRLVDSDTIAYLLAPNINALGRMDSAASAVELFCGVAPDGSQGRDPGELADMMKEMNAARKAEQENTWSICMKAMKEEDCGELFPIIRAPGAHEGVAGIVAGNLKETLHRPVCIVTPSEEGLLKGTGRSVSGINMYELLAARQDLFVRFGGHAGACGFSMREEDLPELRRSMQELVKDRLSDDPEALTEYLEIEGELTEDEKSVEFADALSLLEPFGEGNMRPVFCMRGARIFGLRRMGSDGQHLRFLASTADQVRVPCVLFRKADEFSEILQTGCADIAGELGINEYAGSRRLQMLIRDVRENSLW